MNREFTESMRALSERISSLEGETGKAIAELSGIIKGNHELLKADMHTYVDKESCETHRERHGQRLKDAEDRVLKLEGKVETLEKIQHDKSHNFSDRITAWLPSIITVIGIIAIIVFVVVPQIIGG